MGREVVGFERLQLEEVLAAFVAGCSASSVVVSCLRCDSIFTGVLREFKVVFGSGEDDMVGDRVEELAAADGARAASRGGRRLGMPLAAVDHVFEVRDGPRAARAAASRPRLLLRLGIVDVGGVGFAGVQREPSSWHAVFLLLLLRHKFCNDQLNLI